MCKFAKVALLTLFSAISPSAVFSSILQISYDAVVVNQVYPGSSPQIGDLLSGQVLVDLDALPVSTAISGNYYYHFNPPFGGSSLPGISMTLISSSMSLSYRSEDVATTPSGGLTSAVSVSDYAPGGPSSDTLTFQVASPDRSQMIALGFVDFSAPHDLTNGATIPTSFVLGLIDEATITVWSLFGTIPSIDFQATVTNIQAMLIPEPSTASILTGLSSCALLLNRRPRRKALRA